jgi:hypothetical protein
MLLERGPSVVNALHRRYRSEQEWVCRTRRIPRVNLANCFLVGEQWLVKDRSVQRN